MGDWENEGKKIMKNENFSKINFHYRKSFSLQCQIQFALSIRIAHFFRMVWALQLKIQPAKF